MSAHIYVPVHVHRDNDHSPNAMRLGSRGPAWHLQYSCDALAVLAHLASLRGPSGDVMFSVNSLHAYMGHGAASGLSLAKTMRVRRALAELADGSRANGVRLAPTWFTPSVDFGSVRGSDVLVMRLDTNADMADSVTDHVYALVDVAEWPLRDGGLTPWGIGVAVKVAAYLRIMYYRNAERNGGYLFTSAKLVAAHNDLDARMASSLLDFLTKCKYVNAHAYRNHDGLPMICVASVRR